MIAQDFTVQTHLGNSINLSDYKGKKIWLAFFRYASSPLCNLYINQVINRYDEVVEHDIVFLPVFQSPAEEIQKYVGKNDVKFPILCDPEEKLYKLYNVGKSYSGFLSLSVIGKGIKAKTKGHLPGKVQGEFAIMLNNFVINTNFEIVYCFDGKDIGDHSKLEDIFAASK